ncbi:C1 family peptidase [Leptolyngbya sp. FACHB-711]|uniref:C1 family peptidase n=1 Tax=Leptolyngbya sp. FACHB-711 TaxID=2692813 RepID=UPI00321FAE17
MSHVTRPGILALVEILNAEEGAARMVLSSLQNRKYRIGGYRPGRKPENTKYHHSDRFQADQLPRKVDLRKHMTEVEEQVGNSCVANAFVGAYEYLAKRDLGEAGNVSRLFVYYNARAREGYENDDCGSQMYCAIDSLIEYGACCEDIWANDESLICEEPDTNAYEHAANFKITEAEFIETDLDLWRHTLAEGYPIAFALNTFESFDDATQNRGRVPMPKRLDNVRETHGWHAMLCVGYSDKDRMFIVRNSWGVAWGDRGYCYIPYDYVMHLDYNGHDSWIIKAVNDLDFSVDVWEEGDSVFADEGSLLLYDFYIRTTNPEGFIEELDALCQNYVETEEDYYFDYEEEETEEEYIVHVNSFDLTIDDPDEFLEELDTLCENYASDEDYGYYIESDASEEEEEYSEEESDASEEEEEYSEEEEEYNEEEEEYSEEEYEE